MSSTPILRPSCPPITLIPYTPFSFKDIAQELDAFVEDVYPTLAEIADAPLFTPELQKQFYSFLNAAAEEFISTTPYPGYSRILTVIRTDGIVVVDKTVVNPSAIMIGGVSTLNTIPHMTVTRQNTGDPQPYPQTLYPVNEYLTLKVFFHNDETRYDIFENFGSRTEFVQANIWTYGWTTRPGIYIPGQLYAVAKAVGFYGQNTITFFFRVAYNRSV